MTEQTAAPNSGPLGGTVREDVEVFLRGIFDPHLRAPLTFGMLVGIYRIGYLVAVLPTLILAVLTYTWWPLGWAIVATVVLGPVMYLIILTTLRIGLGFGVAILRFLDEMMRLPRAVQGLIHEVSNLRSGVDLLRGEVAGFGGNVSELQGAVGDLIGQVDGLQGSLDGVQFWRRPKGKPAPK